MELRVQVLNLSNGARLETYVITGSRGSGVICMNGPSAYHIQPGDLVIIIAYALMTPEEALNWRPTVVFVDEQNTIKEVNHAELPMTENGS